MRMETYIVICSRRVEQVGNNAYRTHTIVFGMTTFQMNDFEDV